MIFIVVNVLHNHLFVHLFPFGAEKTTKDPVISNLASTQGAAAWHDDVIKWKKFPRYWPFAREFTGHRWFPLTKASDGELWCFLWSTNGWVNNRDAGDLRRHRAHYDVTVMGSQSTSSCFHIIFMCLGMFCSGGVQDIVIIIVLEFRIYGLYHNQIGKLSWFLSVSRFVYFDRTAFGKIQNKWSILYAYIMGLFKNTSNSGGRKWKDIFDHWT